MARHEFGVMPLAPEAGQRFEKYEPGKYRCIPVEDDEIERLLPETLGLPMYWPGLREAVTRQGGMAELAALLRRAERENKWVIHYGI